LKIKKKKCKNLIYPMENGEMFSDTAMKKNLF
jgi:hypothetical protein